MRNIELIIIAVGLLCVIFFFYYQRKKKSSTIAENFLDNTVFNSPKPFIHKRSLQEMIELSWKFLYDITELISNEFSKKEKEELIILGYILLKKGMRYEHVVRLGIKQDFGKSNVDQSLLSQGQPQQGFIKQ